MNKYSENECVVWLKNEWQRVNLDENNIFGRGRDFYVDVIRHINKESLLSGYTFYICEVMPKELPVYSRKVILVVLSDEHYIYRPYFIKIGFILRTYGAFPQYKDGVPLTWEHFYSFLGYSHKLIKSIISIIMSSIKSRDIFYYRVVRKIFHIPLSCYFKFELDKLTMNSRSIDAAFLGSVSYMSQKRRLYHRFFSPPKLASRKTMLFYLKRFASNYRYAVKIFTTNDFDESIKYEENYIEAMSNCKISICPRGSNYETYRYFESIRLGCVIVCEQLPSAYFYEDSPALIVDNWNKLPDLLHSLLADAALLERLSNQAASYWNRHCSENAVANAISQFCIAHS